MTKLTEQKNGVKSPFFGAGSPFGLQAPQYAPGRNRTFNLGIKSPLLCQLSYGREVEKSARLSPSRVSEGT